jgi:hypothetical protein
VCSSYDKKPAESLKTKVIHRNTMAKSSNSKTGEIEPGQAPKSNILEPTDQPAHETIGDALETNENVILSIDVDGPVTDQGDSIELNGRELNDVAESLGYLAETAHSNESFDVVLNSGNPLSYLEHVTEELAKYDKRIKQYSIDLVGGMGTEYRIDGEKKTLPTDRNRMVETQQEIYSKAAERGWSLNIQNNLTSAVWVNRIEAEEETESNPAFDGEKDTVDLWRNYLTDAPGFELDENYKRKVDDGEGAIVFRNDYNSADKLLKLQRQQEEFIGLRFETNNDGEIVFYRQQKDREIDYNEAFETVADIAEESQYDWAWNSYDDGGFEIWDPGFCGKGEGLDVYRFVKHLGPRSSFHHGDSSSSDYIDSVNSYIIPQKGTKAHRDIENVQDQRRALNPEQDVVSLTNSIKNAVDSQRGKT